MNRVILLARRPPLFGDTLVKRLRSAGNSLTDGGPSRQTGRETICLVDQKDRDFPARVSQRERTDRFDTDAPVRPAGGWMQIGDGR
jgi:hypothetical protein